MRGAVSEHSSCKSIGAYTGNGGDTRRCCLGWYAIVAEFGRIARGPEEGWSMAGERKVGECNQQQRQQRDTYSSRFSNCNEPFVRAVLTLLKVSRKEMGILDDPGIFSSRRSIYETELPP